MKKQYLQQVYTVDFKNFTDEPIRGLKNYKGIVADVIESGYKKYDWYDKDTFITYNEVMALLTR